MLVSRDCTLGINISPFGTLEVDDFPAFPVWVGYVVSFPAG